MKPAGCAWFDALLRSQSEMGMTRALKLVTSPITKRAIPRRAPTSATAVGISCTCNAFTIDGTGRVPPLATMNLRKCFFREPELALVETYRAPRFREEFQNLTDECEMFRKGLLWTRISSNHFLRAPLSHR